MIGGEGDLEIDEVLRIARLAAARVMAVYAKVARVARGEADLYVYGGAGAKRWDSCAPEAVLSGAGGRFTDLRGASIDYADPELGLKRGIVASNGLLHGAALAVTS